MHRLYFSHVEVKNKNSRGQTCQLILNDEIVNARLCNRCLLPDTRNIPLAVALTDSYKL